MDAAIARQLVDKIYEKRKAAALDLEKRIRECHQKGEHNQIGQIIDQLIEMFNNATNPLHIRNGGLIGLAGTAIALGVDIAPYMDKFILPLLNCFVDAENRIRYFSAECLYNIAKVSKGEVLVYFNEIFDALSKLAADSELSVKNGAELLDRLLKDIVAESASVYIPMYPDAARARDAYDQADGVLVTLAEGSEEGPKKAFSLPHFIPLLKERIFVVSPFTRSYLVSWISVLNSVPELELITYLPEFLDGLLKYISDPTDDVRVATENVLSDFMRELRAVTEVNQALERQRQRHHHRHPETTPRVGVDTNNHDQDNGSANWGESGHRERDELVYDTDDHYIGEWTPGQGVRIDFPGIIDILLQQLDELEHDEIQQSTALRWLGEFLTFAPEVMVPFTPRLITAILPKIAHHVAMIQSTAIKTNKLLFNVIQYLPLAQEQPPASPQVIKTSFDKAVPSKLPLPRSPTPTISGPGIRQSGLSKEISKENEVVQDGQRSKGPSTPDLSATPRPPQGAESNSVTDPVRAESPAASIQSQTGVAQSIQQPVPPPLTQEELDPFDYQGSVSELIVQLLSKFEETRVSALQWLIMLHQKVLPKNRADMDAVVFPVIFKMFEDSSEEVIKHNLQLIAQIASTSEENYLNQFMGDLLKQWSTDRPLFTARGSLIIRQLCANLSTEKIYRTFSEILEKEEDLEFASELVQKLNIILITSPELADFRRRLKTLETRQDGQALFISLYRCWCHSSVSVFALCLISQAYEHASNLLHIFADLEITVPMLVQVDKLVQLIESPVFTYLRLQLLEPERYPYLYKCLYGLLMLLPQSSAFVSLRNRLNAVNSAGFLQIAPKSTVASISSRSKLGRDEIKWQELLQHFRVVQSKHEKARRQATGIDPSPLPGSYEFDKMSDTSSADSKNNKSGRIPMRRRVTGGDLGSPAPPAVSIPRAGALSPLNPKARVPAPPSTTNPTVGALLTHAQKARRPDLPRK